MLTYYSSIIPNSFRCLLFSKLCQHNWSRPNDVSSESAVCCQHQCGQWGSCVCLVGLSRLCLCFWALLIKVSNYIPPILYWLHFWQGFQMSCWWNHCHPSPRQSCDRCPSWITKLLHMLCYTLTSSRTPPISGQLSSYNAGIMLFCMVFTLLVSLTSTLPRSTAWYLELITTLDYS